MITAGVTGGIGSGKTTLCREFEKLGAFVVYADDLAKELMVQDENVIHQLTETFGRETYFEDGSLNKSHLIREAFQKGRVEELNGIVHPAVNRKFKDITGQMEKTGTKVLVKEAALLLNQGRPKELDVIILVLSDKEHQLKRVTTRDQVSASEIEARMVKQPDFKKLIPLADYVLYNNDSLKKFREKARNLYEKLIQLQ